jgi:hypothetical protein
LTDASLGEYEGVCLNPKGMPPDGWDDVMLGKMIKEAEMFYMMELKRLKQCYNPSNILLVDHLI